MSQDAFGVICTKIRSELFSKLKRRDDARHQFAPRGTAAAVLHRQSLSRWFNSLDNNQLGVDEATFITRIRSRSLHDFLAILIFAAEPLEAARRFVLVLVADDSWPITLPGQHGDEHLASLPASDAQLKYLFPEAFYAHQFDSHQATFCPVVLKRRAEVFVQRPQSQRLPYLSEQPIAQGSFGKVYKVLIAKGHFFDPSSETHAHYNTEDLPLARKDYSVSAEFPPGEERRIMDQILGSNMRRHENILENFGSLNIAPYTYSLFMPLATYDLRAYMMDLHKTPPTSLGAKAGFVLSAVGLAEGLSFLHGGILSEDLEELVCYHMDLKPDNILIFRDEEDRYVWKLSDFGMARIKIRRRSGQHREEEKDFNSWFERRIKQTKEPSTDHTVNRRGEGTYLAPESMSTNANMNTPSDVWSLGCVLSVLFTYLDDGQEGIAAYQRARMRHANANGFDRFFLATNTFSANKVHPEIETWHQRLIKAARARSLQEMDSVSYALKHLQTAVFRVNPRERGTAKDVVAILKNTYRIMTTVREPRTTPALKSKTWWKGKVDEYASRLRDPKQQLQLSQMVHGWRQRDLENYKGCAIARDGTLVAYWTDVKIAIFSSQSFSLQRDDEVTPADDFTLPPQQGIWSSLSLVDNWLIASTSGANFQCYIFDLEGGTAPDASLQDRVWLSLPEVPEIRNVVITPDGRKVICTLRHWTDDRKPGALLHAGITELRRWSRRRPSVQSPGPAALPPWHIIDLDWPAVDITNLVPSRGHDVYMVVQPELTYRTQGHRVSIVCLSLQTKAYDTLNIEAQGLDTSTTVTLFTTLALFSQAKAVVVISREKRLIVQQMADPGWSPQRTPNSDTREQRSDDLQQHALALAQYSLAPPPHTDRRPSDQSTYSSAPLTLARAITSLNTEPPPQVIEMEKEMTSYRILRLMVSRDDRRLYCIGTAIASHRLLLFTIDLPNTAGDKLKVVELAQLGDLGYGDVFTAQLAEKTVGLRRVGVDSNDGDRDEAESGTYVLVAALVGRGKKAIYRVQIPEQQTGHGLAR